VTSLAITHQLENLQAIYAAWLELRLKRAAASATRRQEHERLSTKAEYLLNTVAAARDLPAGVTPAESAKDESKSASKAKGKSKSKSASKSKAKPKSKSKSKSEPDSKSDSSALTALDPLQAFHAQARAELEKAQASLNEREQREESAFQAQEEQLQALLRDRVDAHLKVHKPKLALTVHPVGKERVLIQVERPNDEDAMLLLRLLRGQLPTRWGFFSDDAVEDPIRGPARLYPDIGVQDVWPSDADAEDDAVARPGAFSPVRVQLPFSVPGFEFPRFRLVHRGPVAEFESRRRGEPYGPLMPREDGEKLTGYLLRLKLAGTLELELEVG
jgi:hypothetical protein